MALISNQGRKSDPIFTDEVTRQKIQRHLSDINDKITDEDIQNVKTDVTPNAVDSEINREVNKLMKVSQDSNKGDGNNSNSVQTPWNIIQE